LTHLQPYRLSLTGKHLVEASAGTGKTHAITSIVLKAVIELGLLPSQVLVVTFTRAATAELKSRIRRRLRLAERALAHGAPTDDSSLQDYLSHLADRTRAHRHLSRALDAIDEAAIFTIHGFCQRILEQCAFESKARFELELLESLEDLREEALNDALVSELVRAHPAVVRRFNSRAGAQRTAQLLQAICRRPELRVLPDIALTRPIDDSIARFRQAQAQARSVFDRDAICQLLARDTGLNRKKVSIKHLPNQLKLVERLLETGADAEPWPDRCVFLYSFLQQSLNKGHTRVPEHAFFHACDRLHAAHQHLQSHLESEQFSLELNCTRLALKLESSRKTALAVQGFDDLLLHVRSALTSSTGDTLASALRQRYPIALIDEFQDTDPIQYEIFSRIYAEPSASLFLIGDPKQSIYSFRGADLHAYLTAAKTAALNRHNLETNWRSDPGLIGAVNALYLGQNAPFLYPEILYRSVRPRPDAVDQFDDRGQPLTGLTIACLASDDPTSVLDRMTARQRVAFHTALQVQELVSRPVQGRGISPKDIAILTRTNAEAVLVQQALLKLNLQSALATDTSVFSTDDALQLTTLLSALIKPYDSPTVTSALLTPGFNHEPARIATRPADDPAWDIEVEHFTRGHDLLIRHGIFAAAQYLFDKHDTIANLLLRPGGERHVTNLYHLLELTEAQRCKQNLPPAALLRWLQRMRLDPTSIANETRQLRIESDDDSVVITTVHRSKGLEYPYVFCPFLWADHLTAPGKNDILNYHDDADDDWIADLRGNAAGAAAIAAALREREAEALRLIYVAITRASHAVTVFVPNVRGLQQSALGQLLFKFLDSNKVDIGETSFLELRRGLLSLKLPAGANLQTVDAMDTHRPTAARPSPEPRALRLRGLTRRISNSWVASSFSAMVAGLPAHTLSANDELGKDVDGHHQPRLQSPAEQEPARFSSLPPGAESGDTLHKIFERIDFVNFDPTSDAIVEPLLARMSPDLRSESTQVGRDVSAVLEAPLLASNPTFRLRELDAAARRSELPFSLGVGFDREGRVERHVSSAELAEILTPAATGLDESYASAVRQLSFAPLAGYLRGYIDLVFEHQGKTYVVDYKSTSVSDSIAGFSPERVAHAVAANHYALQTALYSLVMHRYLRWRKPDYDYDRDFGGTLVVFLRGVCPTRPPGHSVHFHRASRAAIEALDALFSGTVVT
jgi:exodeoxyribonuclease V beta subunit